LSSGVVLTWHLQIPVWKILCYTTFAKVSISAISLQEKGESNLLYAIVYIILWALAGEAHFLVVPYVYPLVQLIDSVRKFLGYQLEISVLLLKQLIEFAGKHPNNLARFIADNSLGLLTQRTGTENRPE